MGLRPTAPGRRRGRGPQDRAASTRLPEWGRRSSRPPGNPMSTPSLTTHARREQTGWLRSLARFTGLATLAAAIARGPLWRTRQNRATAAGVGLGAVAMVALVALLIPSARSPIASVLRAPGGIGQ